MEKIIFSGALLYLDFFVNALLKELILGFIFSFKLLSFEIPHSEHWTISTYKYKEDMSFSKNCAFFSPALSSPLNSGKEGTERVGSDFGGEELFNFLSRSDGGSGHNKKNSGRRNAISIYIPVANSFTSERAFFVTKLPFRDAKFLANRDRVPLQNSPFQKVEIWLAFFAFRGR